MKELRSHTRKLETVTTTVTKKVPGYVIQIGILSDLPFSPNMLLKIFKAFLEMLP